MAKEIRISQCMIVKNEERNIRQALSWAKDIVQEQIVVDTGSTDRTVEIARSMGAKIFHFEWCDDFSAAKNYAIEQASGDWIAFLDADEYFTPEDTKKIPDIIRAMEQQFSTDKMPDIIRATWAQLNDEGKVFAVSEQDRIFRNRADIRYKNPIHEILASNQGKIVRWLDVTELLSIMHTGYLNSIITEKGKRNVPILRKAVQENPEDYDLWGYLSESLLAEGKDEEALQIAEKVMEEGINKAQEPRINAALMTWYTAASSGNAGEPAKYKAQAYRLYERYCNAGFSYPDIDFGMGCYLMKIGETTEVIPFFEASLQKLEHYKGVNALKMAGGLKDIYSHLALFYAEKQNAQKAVYYSTLSLRVDKFQEEPLSCLLKLLKNDRNTTAEQALEFLGKLYDTADSQKDKFFILRQTVKTGYQQLEKILRDSMTKEEAAALESKADKSWIENKEILSERYPGVCIKNRTDRNFLHLIDELRACTLEELYKNALASELVNILKEHWKDIVILYETLSDYRSRQCLYGLMETWMHRENRIMKLVRENGLEFWDMDIIPTAEGINCVNIGKNAEEALNGFLYTYEDTYQKIYCFVDEKEENKAKKEKLSEYREVSLMEMKLETLCLDESVKEPADLIRIDLSAPVLPILEGCKRHISKEMPTLAICLDSDCNNLWKIPKILREWNSEYKFYLRYYGNKEIPDRIVLFAV